MQKINFQDLPSTSTPIDSTNLNLLQQNVEDDIGDLSTLNTTEKSSLVGAINSIINSNKNQNNGYFRIGDFQFAWKRLDNQTLGGNKINDYWYFSNHYMGDWDVPFTSILFNGSSVSSTQFISNTSGMTLTNAGVVRAYRGNAVSSVEETVIVWAIGTWK